MFLLCIQKAPCLWKDYRLICWLLLSILLYCCLYWLLIKPMLGQLYNYWLWGGSGIVSVPMCSDSLLWKDFAMRTMHNCCTVRNLCGLLGKLSVVWYPWAAEWVLAVNLLPCQQKRIAVSCKNNDSTTMSLFMKLTAVHTYLLICLESKWQHTRTFQFFWRSTVARFCRVHCIFSSLGSWLNYCALSSCWTLLWWTTELYWAVAK